MRMHFRAGLPVNNLSIRGPWNGNNIIPHSTPAWAAFMLTNNDDNINLSVVHLDGHESTVKKFGLFCTNMTFLGSTADAAGS